MAKEEKEREKLGRIVRKQIVEEDKKDPVLFSLDKKLEEKRKKALAKRVEQYAIKNKRENLLVPGIPVITGVDKIGNDKTADFLELRNEIQENKVSEEIISP